jgi:hypothetical protein
VFKHPPQRLAQIVEGVIEVLKARERIVEAGVEQIVRERLQQVFKIDLRGQIAVELGLADALHGESASTVDFPDGLK